MTRPDGFELVGYSVLSVLVAILLYLLFYLMPIALTSESKCLKAGYPSTQVDYLGNAYCANLEGSVTVRVDKVQDVK